MQRGQLGYPDVYDAPTGDTRFYSGDTWVPDSSDFHADLYVKGVAAGHTLTIVPEPSTLVLLACAGTAIILARRRRYRKWSPRHKCRG